MNIMTSSDIHLVSGGGISHLACDEGIYAPVGVVLRRGATEQLTLAEQGKFHEKSKDNFKGPLLVCI